MRHLSLAILAGLALPGVAGAADPPCHSQSLILDCYPSEGANPLPEHLERLDAIAKRVAQSYFTKSPVDFITIDGFAAKWKGTNPKAISQTRAQIVQRELEERLRARGVVVENLRVLVRGLGDGSPRVSDSTQHGRAINRRVEIRLSAPDGWVYASLPTPLRSRLQRLRIEHNEYDFAEGRPDDPPIKLTGTHAARYEPSSAKYPNNRIAVQINQAGRYLLLWYTRYHEEERETLKGDKIPMTTSLHGTGEGSLDGVKGDEVSFDYTIRGGESFTGTISANRLHGGLFFDMESGAWKGKFERQSTTPRVSERAIAALPDARLRRETKSFQEYPFLEEEFRDTVNDYVFGTAVGVGSKESLLGLIRQYVEKRGSEKAIAIEERFVSQIVANVDLVHMGLVDRWVRARLSSKSPDDKRTYLEWMYLICKEHPGHLEVVRTHTTCIAGPAKEKHVYEWAFFGIGAGGDIGFFGGSYYRGHMRIRKMLPDPWTKDYPAYVGGFGVGPSVGVQGGVKLAEGTLTSDYEWDEKNFIGDFQFYEGSLLSITDPTGDHSIDKTTVTFDGDGKLPALSGVAEETDSTGLGISAGSAILVGEIYATGDERDKELKLVKDKAASTKLDSRYGASGALHFDVDETTLTNPGRDLLRQMLATHLAVFMNPASELRIDGHASPSGTAKHNDELSWVRAVNVLQGIDDILGMDFKIKPDNVVVKGWGERESAKKLGPDAESAEWRKVDITLDGKLALTLKAPE